MQDAADQLVQSVTAWTRWWCLTTKVLGLVFQKRAWGVMGAFLKKEKAIQRTDLRIAILRKNWSQLGRVLDAIKTRGQVVFEDIIA